LKEENERLKEMMEKMQKGQLAGIGLSLDRSTSSLSKEEVDAMRAKMEEEIRAQLARNSQMMQDNSISYEERVSSTLI
jgi:hypothetical protein